MPGTVKDLNIGDFFYLPNADHKGTRCNVPYACFGREEDGITAKGLLETRIGSKIGEFYLPNFTEVEIVAD
ncbi:MAG: hypothetical protein HC770_10970 [Pseudanabaena sp. CRU_2_10]|nr:hypothetical protein [Pseudanabaena sp. CRU_2_10]